MTKSSSKLSITSNWLDVRRKIKTGGEEEDANQAKISVLYVVLLTILVLDNM